MRQYLSLVTPKRSWSPLSSDQRARVLASGIVGLDVRLGTEQEQVAIGSAAGSQLEATGTAWIGRQSAAGYADVTEELGHQQGRYWAKYALQRGLKSFRGNAEKDVWRGPGLNKHGKSTAHPKAVDFLNAFASSFRLTAPAVQLRYVGFAVPAWHYPGAAFPAAAQALWDACDVMAYQSTWHDIIATLARARKQWPRHELGAFAGVGRIDADGQVVGNAAAWERVVRERVAGISSLIWYVGNGAEDQVLIGHERHPALIEMVPRIARAAQSPEACA